MVNFLNLETAKTPDMQVDWNRTTAPLQNALSGYRDGMNDQHKETVRKENQTYQRGRDAKQDQAAKIKRGGDMAFAIGNMPDNDPAKPIAWKRYLQSFGDGDHSPEELDFRTGPKIAAAAAGQWRDPRDSQMKDLEIEQKRAQINNLHRKEDATKVVVVNGRLVRVPQSGPAQEIYNSGPDTTSRSKGAPSGYLWKDPNNPAAGVESIPGFDKPIPGDVAGKVAMMNMAQKRIEATRGVFERDWSAGDTAQYGAANMPLVGDLGFASGDIGIAQRDIRTGVEAALRTMTGAAAPEQEVARYMQMFMPNIKDTKQTAKQKIDGLMKFMTDANELVLRGRGDTQGINPQQAAPQAPQAQPQQSSPVPVRTPEEAMALPPGTQFITPDGRTKVRP